MEDLNQIYLILNAFGYNESVKTPKLFYKNYDNCLIGFFDFRENMNYHTFYVKFEDFNKPDLEIIKKKVTDDFFNITKEIKIFFEFNQRTKCSNCNKYTICKRIASSGFNSYFDLYFCCQSCEDKKDILIREFERQEIRESEEARVEGINYLINKRESSKCDICNKKLNLEFDQFGDPSLSGTSRDGHHIDYIKDKKIHICKSCHRKIHSGKYLELKKYKPIGTRKEFLEKKNEEKLKRAEERKIKREERLKEIAKKKAESQSKKDYKLYSRHLKNSKDWYKRL